jgi:hypothetical protein
MKTTLLFTAALLLASLSSKAQTDQTWMDLDGVNDYLDLGTDPVLAGKTQFTLEMRMHFDNSAGEYTIIGQRTSDANRTLVIQRWAGALYILFDGINYASCPFEACTTERSHLAAVYDGTGATNTDRLKFYINGVAQTLTYTGTIPATTLVTSPAADLVLGCENNGPGTQLQFLDGQFGEVCIWDHALTPAEITGRVIPEVAGTESGLMEYFHFDNGVPGGDNTGITSFAGGNDVSTIVPTNMAMTGTASNFTGSPVLTGTVDVSVSVAGNVLTANATGAAYQWLDCDNGLAPIPGATSQSYTALESGNYAVLVTAGLCANVSECVEVLSTGIAAEQASRWIIYPNPVADELTIELGGKGEAQPFDIMDPMGRLIRKGNVNGRATIEVPDLAPGIYLLRIGTGSARSVKVFEKD